MSRKYFPRAMDLAEIIEDGRADTLKEAINVMISDDNAAHLLAEEQRKNDIMQEEMQKQREAEERHQLEMERYARQQADAAQEQTRLVKEKAKAEERDRRYREIKVNEAQLDLERAANNYAYSRNPEDRRRYEADMAVAKGEIDRWK